MKILLSLTVGLTAACTVVDADLTATPAIASLSATPAATTTNVFSVGVTGQLDFGYTSNQEATLEILVDGASVHQESFAVLDGLTASFDTTVPLAREGTNEVVVVARYAGQEQSQRATVTVAMDPATVGFPTWATDFVPHASLTASGDLTVTVDPAYTIDAVTFAVDGAPAQTATDLGGGQYHAAIVDPDIGDSDVAVTVISSNDGHAKSQIFHGTLTVAPIFDCAAASSMLPSNDFDLNLRSENRLMAGYFGKANGGHDIAFDLSGTVQATQVDVVGTTVTRGTTEMEVTFAVSPLRCNNNQNPCDLAYGLDVLVDGVSLCNQASFGLVHNAN